MARKNKEKKAISVSEYLVILNRGLKQFRARIMGEVSELSFGPTGHVYFALKDDKDESILECMMFEDKYELYGVELKQGQKFIVSGVPNLHGKYGFSFIARTIEYAGEGKLKKQYEKLKKKLTAEGLFAEERKRRIPPFVKRIGLITSRDGAAIGDFMGNLGNFGFRVSFMNSRVEGQAALRELLSAVRFLKDKEIEVLVITRGGGSLESLMAFNNEVLVREIADFPVPVIAAIGHEKDIPLVCEAADLSVSTSSIAARQITEPWNKISLFIDKNEEKILSRFKTCLSEIKGEIDSYDHKVKTIFLKIVQECHKTEQILGRLISKLENTILKKKRFLDRIGQKIEGGFRSIFQEYREIERGIEKGLLKMEGSLNSQRKELFLIEKGINRDFSNLLIRYSRDLDSLEEIIKKSNPERQLLLGYSVVRAKGEIIKSITQLKEKQRISTTLSDGMVDSEIKKIKKSK